MEPAYYSRNAIPATGDIRGITFRWTVKNFSSLGKHGIPSNTWAFASGDWRLELYPSGRSKEDESFISLHIRQLRGDNCDIRFSISIINIFNESCNTISEDKTSNVGNDCRYGAFRFISRSELVAKGLLVGDKLEIVCTMETGEELPEHDQIVEVLQDIDDSQFKSAIERQHTDVDTTMVVKSQEFQVHKSVLSVQSEVFAAMFHHNMKESSTNTVTIDDCDPTVFKEFLRFIYSNRVRKLTDVQYRELYACADKYSVDGLKQVCRKAIRHEMSVYNAVDILVLAEKYGDTSLRKDAVKFISLFPNTITAKSGWKCLYSYPELMEMIITSSAAETMSDKLMSIK